MALDIDGLGKKIVEQLFEEKILCSIDEVFSLDKKKYEPFVFCNKPNSLYQVMLLWTPEAFPGPNLRLR